MSRNYHALNTKYNVLYNAQLGMDKGLENLKMNTDNFWDILPIEKLDIVQGKPEDEKNKNANFEISETKSTKAIQKHSMDIDGKERNSQSDEAYLILGKSRYYDQRFIPALDAFNYILYKYPTCSNIYEAKIWREKTNMRLGNENLAIENIKKLLKDKKVSKQIFADANALMAECYLNLEEKDSAIMNLRKAQKTTPKNEERARYSYILGQIYEKNNKKDSAIYFYDAVVKLNRKIKRDFLIHACTQKLLFSDCEDNSKILTLKKFDKLIENRENQNFLGVLYYKKGVFLEKCQDPDEAIKNYKKSLKKPSEDTYLAASGYINIANIYFRKPDYLMATKYLDSTLTKLDNKSKEFLYLQKKRKDLEDVIRYENIAKTNDSILNLVAMPNEDKISYFLKHIEKIKIEDEKKRLEKQKEKEIAENKAKNAAIESNLSTDEKGGLTNKMPPMSIDNKSNVFYFYNPSTVAYGKVNFRKNFGNRPAGDNWIFSDKKQNITTSTSSLETTTNNEENKTDFDKKNQQKENINIDEKYTPNFYINKLPSNKVKIDSINKERNDAYYQLGVIYKEKFKEYKLASDKLEQLLKNKPEEKMILPTLYNLYKIYEITDAVKAETIKKKILSEYPKSRYAQIINHENDSKINLDLPENKYKEIYKLFQEELFELTIKQCENMIVYFSGETTVPKFELLKANAIGKLKGLTAYKEAMKMVAKNYPNTEEGKNANEILTKQIPLLEQMNFSLEENINWKILFKISLPQTEKEITLENKIRKTIESFFAENFSYTCDTYTEKEQLIVIQGFKSQNKATQMANKLKDLKDKAQEPIIISGENYKIVKIKKNLEAYEKFIKDENSKKEQQNFNENTNQTKNSNEKSNIEQSPLQNSQKNSKLNAPTMPK